jgi:hypothetical protein
MLSRPTTELSGRRRAQRDGNPRATLLGAPLERRVGRLMEHAFVITFAGEADREAPDDHAGSLGTTPLSHATV